MNILQNFIKERENVFVRHEGMKKYHIEKIRDGLYLYKKYDIKTKKLEDEITQSSLSLCYERYLNDGIVLEELFI